MANIEKSLIDLRTKTNFNNIETYVREHAQRVDSRLWIASPYIGEEWLFYSLFQISKIKKHKPNFKLLTDINNISYRNYNVLKFFIENNNAELRTLEHLHSKIYIMDNYPVIASANLTYYGFYVNFESAVAGDNLDIERYEQLYNEHWNMGKTVDEDLLKIALENSTYQDIEAYNPNVKPIRKLPKELTEKCNYEQFLREFNKLSEKYLSYGRIWESTSLKFEIDSFLNYLFHHSESHSSQEYYYINEINPMASDLLLKQCINEFQEWVVLETTWDNETIRETYKNNALSIFAEENSNNVTIEDIAAFLSNNINTYLTNAARFNWSQKFIEKNNSQNVYNFIMKLKNSTPKDIDKLVKKSEVAYMGESTLQELLGLIREDLPIRNENTNAGLRYLGYNV